MNKEQPTEEQMQAMIDKEPASIPESKQTDVTNIKDLFDAGLKNLMNKRSPMQYDKRGWQRLGVNLDWPKVDTIITLCKDTSSEQSYKVGKNGNFIKV